LAAYYPAALQANRLFSLTSQPVIRLSIGLEEPDELIGDLRAGLSGYSAALSKG
jgi:cystathionine beta-lyase